MLEVATDIVKALRSMNDYAEGAVSYSGIVRLGMPDAIADYLGSERLSAFFEKFPDIHVENTVSAKMPDMSTLEADICLNYETLPNEDLVLIRSKTVPCGLFASQEYLTKYGLPKNMDDMLENHRICDKYNHIYMMAHKDTKDMPRIRAALDYLKGVLDEKYA